MTSTLWGYSLHCWSKQRYPTGHDSAGSHLYARSRLSTRARGGCGSHRGGDLSDRAAGPCTAGPVMRRYRRSRHRWTPIATTQLLAHRPSPPVASRPGRETCSPPETRYVPAPLHRAHRPSPTADVRAVDRCPEQLRVGARRAGEIIWALASPDVARMLCNEIGWTESQYARWLVATLIRTLLPDDERSGQPVTAVSPSGTSDRHANPGSRCDTNCPGSRWAVSGRRLDDGFDLYGEPERQYGNPDGRSGGSTDAVTEGTDE